MKGHCDDIIIALWNRVYLKLAIVTEYTFLTVFGLLWAVDKHCFGVAINY